MRCLSGQCGHGFRVQDEVVESFVDVVFVSVEHTERTFFREGTGGFLVFFCTCCAPSKRGGSQWRGLQLCLVVGRDTVTAHHAYTRQKCVSCASQVEKLGVTAMQGRVHAPLNSSW